MKKLILLTIAFLTMLVFATGSYASACGMDSCDQGMKATMGSACGMDSGHQGMKATMGSDKSVSATAKTVEKPKKFANVYATDKNGMKYAVCPVTGEEFEVSKNSPYSVIDGKGYYHCCNGCVAPFKSNPKKYLKGFDSKLEKAKKDFKDGKRPSMSDM